MKPLFSIIVPAYNCEQYVEHVYSSITSQDFHSYEIVLVDDGSTDKTLMLCQQIAKQDSRVKVFTKKHSGPCASRNLGISKAEGEYILYVDCDDKLTPNALKILSDNIHKYNFPDMLVYKFCRDEDSSHLDGFNIKPGYYSKQQLHTEYVDKKMFSTMINNAVVLNNCNACYKRQLISKHYCKNENIIIGEDWAYSYECLYYANNIVFIDDCLYSYIQRNNSVMSSSNDEIYELSQFVQMLKYMWDSFVKDSKDINERFAECCLYGVSLKLSKIFGDLRIWNIRNVVSQLPEDLSLQINNLLAQIVDYIHKPKDKLFIKNIIKHLG